MNSTFIGYEELSRSRRVLSTEAETHKWTNCLAVRTICYLLNVRRLSLCLFLSVKFLFYFFLISFNTEQKVPPSNVQGQNTSSTSIFVQWDSVPVADQNGIILRYTVAYAVLPSNGRTQSKVVEAPATDTTLTGLNEFTNYLIVVFASTSKGSGDYSFPIIVITDQDSKFVVV